MYWPLFRRNAFVALGSRKWHQFYDGWSIIDPLVAVDTMDHDLYMYYRRECDGAGNDTRGTSSVGIMGTLHGKHGLDDILPDRRISM